MTSPRSWSAILRKLPILSYGDLYELADLLQAYADLLDSHATRGRAGGLKTAAGMTVAQKRERARKGGLAARKRQNYDPSPWCHQCGARKPENCKCGPIADNQ